MNSAVHISNMHNVASVTSHTGRCAVHREAGKKCVRKADHIFLDRIDLQVEIQAVPFKDISKAEPGEPSEMIRQRVIAARKIQTERFKEYYNSLSPKGERGGVRGFVHCNAQMTERMIHQFAEPDTAGVEMLRIAMERLSLSARAYNRILKVARTIADLAGSENVMVDHLAEAISYRNLDRADWAER